KTDNKRCLTPNPWIVFLRTHKNQFHSIGEASISAGKVDQDAGKTATMKRTKEVYRQVICSHSYKHLKYNGNKKNVKSGVTKILNNKSIPDTLAILGATKPAKALATKEKAVKKADADLTHAQKVEAFAKKRAARILREKIKAYALARRLKKEANAAKTTAAEAKSVAVVARRVSPRGTKRKAGSGSKKVNASYVRDTQGGRLEHERRQGQEGQVCKTGEDKAAKIKVPRALAGFISNLNIAPATGKRRRRR
ncbi:unnamed protein product, partial [Ascophyllum nodosum]